MFQVIHPPYKKVILACIACLCFEIGLCPRPDLCALFQYTSPIPVVSLHLIPMIQHHSGIPVTLLTGSSCSLFFPPPQNGKIAQYYPVVIGPSTPWQLTVIQWGWRCSHADHVSYLDDDWRCHAQTGPGHMMKTIFLLFCQPFCICSGVVVWRWRFYVFGLQLPGALWCKGPKYLQTHTQVVLFAANPH